MTTTRVQDIDLQVGGKVRELRILRGLTQQGLADLIGVTYQQAHKYERGINRISAGRLQQIATALKVPVEDFFPEPDASISGRAPGLEQERLTLEISKVVLQLPPAIRAHLSAIARHLLVAHQSATAPATAAAE